MVNTLCSLQMEHYWPTLNPLSLSYLELKDDPYFLYLPPSLTITYLEKTIAYGQNAATFTPTHTNLRDLLNFLLDKGLRISYLSAHAVDPQIRAQYILRPPTIEIYENSIQQMRKFMTQQAVLSEDDLISLHLYHEYFHHLETKMIPRADRNVPKCTIKQWGPFTVKKRLNTLREIAAHAFAQTMMKLNWSPLLLDRLIYYTQQGWSHMQIREHFAQVKGDIQAIREQYGTNES